MKKTGVVTHPLYIKHDPGPYHPESPERLKEIYSMIDSSGLGEMLVSIEARPATVREICLVHSEDYYNFVESSDGSTMSLDPDTSTSPDSFRAAVLAVGGALELVDKVVDGELDNGFALVRPPGHHAERAQARGFCLFNNIAICAQHAIEDLGLKRVMIVDWDLHHGNGTMHSFWDRKDILYSSTHQYPYYPGTGALQDIGGKGAEGYTISVPLSTGMGDDEFAAIFAKILLPVAQKFDPELLLVSAGFDTLSSDPLGGMRMSPTGYGVLMKQVVEMASGSASGKVIALLEGGYDVRRQALAVEQVLRVMLGDSNPVVENKDSDSAESLIVAVQKQLSPFWEF